LAGHDTKKALTGGWCEVCSVRYETRTRSGSEESVEPAERPMLAALPAPELDPELEPGPVPDP